MSLLKIYDSSKVESQEEFYDSYCFSILQVEGNFIPAWYFASALDLTAETVYLQVLNKTQLFNKVISADSSVEIGGYTVTHDLTNIYADKQAETLASDTVYRLYMVLNTGVSQENYFYSDIFKKV